MTTGTVATIDPSVRRVPPFGGFNRTLLRLELMRVLRNRRTIIFTLIFPTAMFFVFGSGQGGDEKARGEVQIKDLVLGATLTGIKDRDEYLKKQAEAQFAVPEEKLVESVQRVLARHKA